MQKSQKRRSTLLMGLPIHRPIGSKGIVELGNI
jgi:hypothetical protein